MMNDVGGGEGEEVGEHSTDIWVLDLRGIAAGQHMGSVGHTCIDGPQPSMLCYDMLISIFQLPKPGSLHLCRL